MWGRWGTKWEFKVPSECRMCFIQRASAARARAHTSSRITPASVIFGCELRVVSTDEKAIPNWLDMPSTRTALQAVVPQSPKYTFWSTAELVSSRVICSPTTSLIPSSRGTSVNEINMIAKQVSRQFALYVDLVIATATGAMNDVLQNMFVHWPKKFWKCNAKNRLKLTKKRVTRINSK